MYKHTLALVCSFSFISTIGFFQPAAHAEVGSSATAHDVSDKEIISTLTDAFGAHFKYHGTFRKSYDAGIGLGCRKNRDIFIDWQSRLENLDVQLTDEGVAQFDVSLVDSKAYLSYTGKNSLCIFKGYFGDVVTDNIRGSFYIKPKTDHSPTKIEIKSLALSNLKFENWTLFEPFFYNIKGDAPDYINSWAQKSFNSVVAWFLKSSFADRFNNLVSEKVSDALRKRYEESEHQLFAKAPDSGPRLN